MKKSLHFIVIFTIILSTYSLKAQKISFANDLETNFNVNYKNPHVIVIDHAISEISFKRENTENGYYVKPYISSYGHSNEVGYPTLPTLRKFIEIPIDASVTINIIDKEETIYKLKDHNIVYTILPVQAPVSKSATSQDIVFKKNNTTYSLNQFYAQELVSFKKLGLMRSTNLGILSISPISYNPVTQEIRVVKRIKCEVVFADANFDKTKDLKERTASIFHNGSYVDIPLKKDLFEKDNLTQYPVKYVIVSDPMFEAALQPFIEWKTQKGFKVIEAYTNNPSVGTTTTSIKNYLQTLYNSATPTDPAFSFVLFVGDVAQIPSFSGTTGSHVSDLYYCEYTGDMLPEVYFGRFSANNLTELQPQIDKTIAYEKYLMSNTSFLSKSLLVSGDDSNFATVHGNGHINYGTANYFNSSNNITALTYLYPASTSSATQIKQDFSNGVGFVNYTAHCGSNGWAGPYFTTSDIPNLSNAGKYPLMIGNCCQSAKFNENNCFAEAMLRAANKGAVGYIGGSNNTYWDEDYWWGVGYKSIVVNPSYSANALGAFDRAFHTNGEPFEKWFTTQGQIKTAGNLAVTQSGASLTNYYWEIYHLMGDPSLMPYLFEPTPINITYQNTIVTGVNSITINAEPYTYIGISKNGILHGAGLVGASGIITLNIIPFTSPGIAKIVATKQNKQPHINNINVIVPNGPYVIYNAHSVNDSNENNNGLADYGETILLNMAIQNVGNNDALNVSATLTTNDVYVQIIDNIQTFGNINAGDTVTENNAYSISINQFVPDQHKVLFNLEIKDINDSIWYSSFLLTLHAPKFQAISSHIDDANTNNNGILDLGETADFVVNASNIGGANALNAAAELTSLSSNIVVNTSNFNIGSLNSTQSALTSFSITASNSVPLGTPVSLVFSIYDGPYIQVDTFVVLIGEIPHIYMKDTVITTCMMYFFDSGGPNAAYQDDENYIITFKPFVQGHNIKATFMNFNVEGNSWGSSCFDELFVYNGESTSAPLLGRFCGETIPGPFTATNAQGALTFKFTSDYSISYSGWEALIECVPSTSIQENNTVLDLHIYPNPSHGIFNIIISDYSAELIAYEIYNIQGQIIKKGNIAANVLSTIDIKESAHGIYYLKLLNKDGILNKRLITY